MFFEIYNRKLTSILLFKDYRNGMVLYIKTKADLTVADPGGPEARAPLPLFKLAKKDGRHTGPQVSLVTAAPLGQISGSATV